jgi:hypothetical protein
MRFRDTIPVVIVAASLFVMGGITKFYSSAWAAELSKVTKSTARPLLQSRPDELVLRELAGFLERNTSFGEVESFPTIEFMREQDMKELRYGAQSLEAEVLVVSLYDRSSATIYLPVGWQGRSPGELSMLIHEMVHYLQDRVGKKFACPQQQEDEALTIQELWLVSHGSNLEKEFGIDPFTRLTTALCYY